MASSALQPAEVAEFGHELQAMLRAGVPLELGLRGLSGSVSRRVDRTAQELADRLQSGVPLPDALQSIPGVPPSLRAALSAGVRCGRSDEALQDLVSLAFAMNNLRAALLRSLIYPVVLVVVTALLFLLVARFLLPEVAETYRSLRLETPPLIWYWGDVDVVEGMALGLLAIGAVVVAVWYFGLTSIAQVVEFLFRRRMQIWFHLFRIGSIRNDFAFARIAHLLALLTKYEVPLPEALRLASVSADSKDWRQRLNHLAETVESGEPLTQKLMLQQGFPQFLSWLIEVGTAESSLPATLKQAAEFYQQRALGRAEFFLRFVPVAVLIGVGGTLTAMYGVMVFGTMAQLWEKLGETPR
ncbi:type II secretion system F family protein [Planctomicrobium piriforme]|uniref:Type II secretory pathway, component PulF n=1 Tax=Planctomicrobium piriforme TaxID=1576369 RepID=A0A1I3FFT0_9PLAN|nr:type II secretion system F family protein [Planctomicrobium piriforme]SFI09781.1 Type II secretory pathway, component PulF [Planctomicrobium piriforme]